MRRGAAAGLNGSQGSAGGAASTAAHPATTGDQRSPNKSLKAEWGAPTQQQPEPEKTRQGLFKEEEVSPQMEVIFMRKLIPVLGGILAGVVSIVPIVGPLLGAVLA
jgi:hypothetical protein